VLLHNLTLWWPKMASEGGVSLMMVLAVCQSVRL